MVRQQRAEWGSGLPKRKQPPKVSLTDVATGESDEDFDSLLKRPTIKGRPDVVKDTAKTNKDENPNESTGRKPQKSKGARDVRSELNRDQYEAKKELPSIAKGRAQLQADIDTSEMEVDDPVVNTLADMFKML